MELPRALERVALPLHSLLFLVFLPRGHEISLLAKFWRLVPKLSIMDLAFGESGYCENWLALDAD